MQGVYLSIVASVASNDYFYLFRCSSPPLCVSGISIVRRGDEWRVFERTMVCTRRAHIVSAALACGMVRYLPELDGIKSVVLAEEDYEHK